MKAWMGFVFREVVGYVLRVTWWIFMVVIAVKSGS